MKLYTTKSGPEGPEVYVSNWVVLIVVIIIIVFIVMGNADKNIPEEEGEQQRAENTFVIEKQSMKE